MPNNVHKSAAVPFVNQKGERSMKRVKVERYVAGKRPAYAKEEDEEYYTTDEEDDHQEGSSENDEDDSDRPSQEASSEDEQKPQPLPGPSSPTHGREVDHRAQQRDDRGEDRDADEDNEEDDDDDPRFRRLKQIERSSKNKLMPTQTIQQIRPKFEDIKKVVINDEDDEEEIRRRHALARKQRVEEPVGLQAVLGDLINEQQSDLSKHQAEADVGDSSKTRIETEDLLKDFMITGFKPKKVTDKTQEEKEAEQLRLKELIDRAKEEAIFTSQVQQKVEEDIKREKEKEALAKGDIGARDMASVKTDDEDDELAYEEWKLREIKRVLRDRTERAKVNVH